MNILFTILMIIVLIVTLWFLVWHITDRAANPFRITFHYESGLKVRANIKTIHDRNPEKFSWSTGTTGRSFLIGMVGASPVMITAVDRRRTLFYR